MTAHPRIRADTGRVAVMRGPLVYCVEATDNGPDLDLALLGPEAMAGVRLTRLEDLGDAFALDLPMDIETDKDWGGTLYREVSPRTEAALRRFVPYYLWDNRMPGEMQIWMRRAAIASL